MSDCRQDNSDTERMTDTRVAGVLRIIMAVIVLTAMTACGGGNKESYSHTINAEEWEAQGGSVYSAEEIADEPEEPDDTSTAGIESEAQQIADVPDASQESQTSGSTEQRKEAEGNSENPESTLPKEEQPRKRVRGNIIGNLAEIFNDSNQYQLEHARRMGIDPITDLRSYYHPGRPLVKVESNSDFKVDELTHSYPYLVPEAKTLLHDIGKAFRDSVKARKGGDYRMIVTSLLRTPVTVRKLRRVNRNATEQSTHQYATTFDITYNKFDAVSGPDNADYGDLKIILAEVIRNYHLQGRCMVKYERKSPCFHITVCK